MLRIFQYLQSFLLKIVLYTRKVQYILLELIELQYLVKQRLHSYIDNLFDIYLHPKLYIHIFVRRNFVMYLFDRGKNNKMSLIEISVVADNA